MAAGDGRITAQQASTPAAAAATQLDISLILQEAQHRWLRPAEICGILQNYRMFRIAPEPPTKPPSGQLFLFDKKAVRFFRKDGHNWRKKRDGKTVKEAHEKLKSGSVDVLHCYYAHGEENVNFQRRTYWMLEEPFTHIALVHYLEVKSGKHNFSRAREAEESSQQSHVDSPLCSNSSGYTQGLLQTMDAESPKSRPISSFDEADTDNSRASTRYDAYTGLNQQHHEDGLVIHQISYPPVQIPFSNIQTFSGYQGDRHTAADSFDCSTTYYDANRVPEEKGIGLNPNGFRMNYDVSSLEEIFDDCSAEFPVESLHSSITSADNLIVDELSSFTTFESPYSISFEELLDAGTGPVLEGNDCSTSADMLTQINSGIAEERTSLPLLKQSSLDLFKIEFDGMKKCDSFSRWMSKEFDASDLQMNSSSDVFWDSVETQNAAESASISNSRQLDTYTVSPSLSQKQLFSIIDLHPTWAYEGIETKVIISGTFLKTEEDIESYCWSCMFGNAEVPAEVLPNGTMRCYAPAQKAGVVPFYVTCSDRLACSEIREFEYRDANGHFMETADSYTSSINEAHLLIRLEKLLSRALSNHKKQPLLSHERKSRLSNTTSYPLVDDKFSNLQVHEEILKEKLNVWILTSDKDAGNCITTLCKEGQGMIHLMAALGYDWAIQPLVSAGINVNFRDAHGWTALHWAAFFGKESTVVALIKLGAAPGAVTDPTPDFPSGRTPADLASIKGHKGISGFLAEFSLNSQLSSLTLRDSAKAGTSHSTPNSVILPGITSARSSHDDVETGSLKDSLSAIRNATQAAAKIHQVFRVESFQRKKKIELGYAKSGLSDEHALSLLSVRNTRDAMTDVPLHAAAIRIQNKFRGWKGRKDFVLIRQQIVKIQAHVRGHQARKQYRKVIWAIGIVQKILRWRRKGSAQHGSRPDVFLAGPSVQAEPCRTEDDVLRQGRKTVEANVERALTRVRSMAQYPEGRDQYGRLKAGLTQGMQSSRRTMQ